jgi:hypothetical protein
LAKKLLDRKALFIDYRGPKRDWKGARRMRKIGIMLRKGLRDGREKKRAGFRQAPMQCGNDVEKNVGALKGVLAVKGRYSVIGNGLTLPLV